MHDSTASSPPTGDGRHRGRRAPLVVSLLAVSGLGLWLLARPGDAPATGVALVAGTGPSTSMVLPTDPDLPTTTGSSTSTATVSTVPATSTTAPTTAGSTATTAAITSDATSTPPPTDPTAPATTRAPRTTTVTEPGVTTVPRTTVPRTTVPRTTVPTTPPAGPNCTAVGTIRIPATGVEQTVIQERTAFRDGLLCGNHKADAIAQGVDILPGFASLADSVAGGTSLVGQVPTIIFGHRISHNKPFLRNNTLRAGDAVSIALDDGSVIQLRVSTVRLVSLSVATKQLLAPSTDGAPVVRLVCCSHADGTPGGTNYRWIVDLAPA
jgi:hypothetical protein